jgi:hypothetical protein
VLVSSCNCLRPRKRNWPSTSDCLFRLLCFSREDHLESVKELTCCTSVKEYCCCTSGSDRDLRIVLARAAFRLVLILDEDCFFFICLAPSRSDRKLKKKKERTVPHARPQRRSVPGRRLPAIAWRLAPPGIARRPARPGAFLGRPNWLGFTRPARAPASLAFLHR